MVIHPIKENVEKVYMCFIMTVMISIAMFYDANKNESPIGYAVLIGCLLLLSTTIILIEGCRMFILDDTGYTVRFLWIKKKYLWKEIKTKTITYYYFKRKDHTYIVGSVFFSPHKRRCDEIFTLLHPFSYLAIEFSDNQKVMEWVENTLNRHGLFYYHVDKDEFLEKMRSWSVELEDKTPVWMKRKL